MVTKNMNEISSISFEIDEIISMYSAYVDVSIDLGDYFKNIMREFGQISEFNIACLMVLENEIVRVFKYENEEVEDKLYILSELECNIYAKIIADKSSVIKHLNDNKVDDCIDLFSDTHAQADSLVAVPIVYNNDVVAVFAISSKKYNISESIKKIEVYIDLLKVRIVNQLAHQSTRFNEEIVYAIDHITDGYFVIRDDLVTLSKKSQKLFGIFENVTKIDTVLATLTKESAEESRNIRGSGHNTISQVLRTIDGKILKLDSFLVELKNNNMVISVVNDITNEKKKLDQFESLAFIDTLTKLKNYNSLMDCLNKLSEYEETTIVNFDINKFKLINDTYGHDVGDIALIFFGRCLKTAYSNLTTNIFRKSGDEFIVILGEEVNRAQKIKAFEDLIECFKDRSNYPQRLTVNLEYSAGVASSKKTKHKKEDLFKFADIAMYEAKNDASGLPYVFFDDDHFETYSIEQENILRIKESITTGNIEIGYRPIANTNGTSHAYKISKRIEKVDLSGKKITELAKKNDFLYEFEMQVIKLVLIEQRRIIDCGNEQLEIHIPIGVDTLVVDSFFDYILELTDKYCLKSEFIVFVVTGLDNTSKIATISVKLGKYTSKGYKLSFDFKFVEFPNPYYIRLVDFEYYNLSSGILKILDGPDGDKDTLYLKTNFNSMNNLSIEPIIEDVYGEKEFESLIKLGINYYTQVGDNNIKSVKDIPFKRN